MTQIREHWVDFAKAICIFLMVVGHANYVEKNVLGFFYYFHMPVFFIVSGYLYRQKTIKETILSCLVPLVVFNLINYPLFLYQFLNNGGEPDAYNLIVKPIIGMILYDGTGINLCSPFWFVSALLLDKLLVRWLCINNWSILIVVISAIIGAYLFNENPNYGYGFLIQKSIISIPFFVFGWKLLGIVIEKIKSLSRIASCFVIIIVCELIFLIYNHFGYVDLYDNQLQNPITYYLGGILGVFLFVPLVNFNFPSKPIFVPLRNISKGTLFILGIHFRLLFCLNSAMQHRYLFANQGIVLALILLLIMYYPMCFVTDKMPYLYGKPIKKEKSES